jgi:hypothetical protein
MNPGGLKGSREFPYFVIRTGIEKVNDGSSWLAIPIDTNEAVPEGGDADCDRSQIFVDHLGM